MKSLTFASFLLVSLPSYSCPFHGLFFLGDDDSASEPKASIGNIKRENSKVAIDIKPKTFYQFKNFNSYFKQWKEEKSEQQKQSSSGSSQTPVVESTKPKDSLKKQFL